MSENMSGFDLQPAEKNLTEEKDANLGFLEDAVSIQSISVGGNHPEEIRKMASLIWQTLKKMGFALTQFETGTESEPGNPVIFGELDVGAEKTVLFYFHYDVQPAPGKWSFDPFNAVIDGDLVYGRGTIDMKGAISAFIAVMKSILKHGKPTVNIKAIFEGEEEIGSKNLEPLIQKHKEEFAADVCIVADADMIDSTTPAITYSLRGLGGWELEIFGPKSDLHSGTYGGIILNPALALSHVINKMIDIETGFVLLPGFYSELVPISAAEHEIMNGLQSLQTPKDFLVATGAPELWGTIDKSPLNRSTIWPALEINGINVGYDGDEPPGTSISNSAKAKITSRLTAGLTPLKVEEMLIKHIENHLPPQVTYKLITLPGCNPVKVDYSSSFITLYAEVMKSIWGVNPVFQPNGGTIGACTFINTILRIPLIICGVCLKSSNIHGENENMRIPSWLNLQLEFLRYIHLLGA